LNHTAIAQGWYFALPRSGQTMQSDSPRTIGRPSQRSEVKMFRGESLTAGELKANSASLAKPVAEHRQAALRFGFGRLVLQDVPVFGKAAVLDPDNIRGDPGDRPAGS
jgi:hypothetical protein